MLRSVTAARTATLVGDFDRRPAYEGLARALTELIGDGRIPTGTRLPSERDLTARLGVSRTTVARAYGLLRDSGYAESRRGAGTFTRMPGSASRVLDRALHPRQDGDAGIDLSCAATSAPPGIAAAYAAAVEDLPAHLGGHGYYPAGLPALQEAVARSYAERGLPTEPGQVVVTPGALSAVAIVGRALAAPGARALVESPSYPNPAQSLRQVGLRLGSVPVDPDGWDLDAVGAAVRQAGADLVYLVPEFQNPTGHLMTEAERAAYAAHLAAAGTLPVVDEAHQWLGLDAGPMPRPFAAYAPHALRWAA
ncbi:PLP-dependent aminotransferase family protein [Nocardioides ferulae]|uniref:aminotransferase-like domain-containing protein n=1 Tax=Nocardioides ferulae TaxID=2340821 RepID=UPI0019819936|nr:PLP-dependent aminotransferase family protein [Nocardioides ferulae]